MREFAETGMGYNKNVYIEQIKKMEQKISDLESRNAELERKYKKYYGYTLKHLEDIKKLAGNTSADVST